MTQNARITAVLGPTNTGKTHYAIERMLGHRTGVIGLPLRLLAREVYDKIVAARGPSVVALVTGEERIVPPRAQYWVCTVEAMPDGMGADFVAVDEIQLCADPERGHVFTDRLLRARGLLETVFLGSDTIRSTIAQLVPGVEFMQRQRMSQLRYSGSRKISRMKPRSAIVGFSVEDVYAIAELIRRQRGGAAVVMGALSPRTRNAQVELYQNGDVDFLVATDAIGMGLNLDIDHVAFSSIIKFDGRRMRYLEPAELAQVAGRAGRGMSDGSFGVTGEAPALPEDTVEAIEEHQFAPIRKVMWRNAALKFGTIDTLIRSLEETPRHDLLLRAREADDLMALKSLQSVTEIRARASDPASVRLLWDVCRIPDFRGISHNEHAGLLEQIFNDLHEYGRVPNDWLARQIQRIDRTDGDIDTLSKRLAFIRTWTYVAQRASWVDDETHWREETRAVEDRLSDALHERLTQRFVDRRTSVLLRRLKQKEALLAEVNDQGEVTVEGEFVGRLEGFRFRQDKDATAQEAKTLRQASLQALAPHFHLRADRFYNAPDTEIDFTEQGGLMWGDQAVGKLVAGADPLKPQVSAFVDDEAGPEVAQKVERRLQHFIDRKVAALFEPLLNLSRDEALNGLARGFAFQMVENLGIIPRGQVADEVKALDQEARGGLRKHGIRFGQFTIFMPLLLKPAPTRLRLVLWSLAKGLQEFPESPPPGLVTVPALAGMPDGFFAMSGYRAAGERAIRIDMLERLADMLRAEDSRAGFEAKADMLSITGMTLEQFADLMQGLGYAASKAEREKVKAALPAAETTPQASEEAAADTPAAEPAAATSDETVEAVPEAAPEEAAADAPEATDAPEMEVFYTFTWGARRQAGGKPRGDRPRGKQGDRQNDRPRGPKKGGKQRGDKPRNQGAKTFEARPPRREKPIDPDNPFAAALMGLKDKT
ncbi:helicase-related protein [Thalassovita sp.]|uniref:helicase-related protein n=1 Tax=Thalassovita sp. TaxID=1979401 RepID=UPI0028825938|nr:helicase-related protein [Thalassovita sp.]MDF1802709.1 helicase-related protein [Thalassovita sp.]